jgi:hypothetical protein
VMAPPNSLRLMGDMLSFIPRLGWSDPARHPWYFELT